MTVRPRWRRAPAAVVLCLLLPACTRPPPTPATGAGHPCGGTATSPPAGAPAVTHIFVVVFENHAFDQIIGNADAPFFNELASACGVATNYQTITHPSLPNYIALVGGDTFGIHSDCTDCYVDAPSLADQIETAGLTWRTYAEGMPEPCFLGSKAGYYGKKHNPFAYYDDVRNNAVRCRRGIVPLDALRRDIERDTLPNLSLIVPDQCHDMHSCDVAKGDAWLRAFLPSIFRSGAYKDGGLLFVTFDEGEKGVNDRILTILAARSMRPRSTCRVRADHYSLLRTIEDEVGGLPPLGHAQERASLIGCFS